MKNKLNDYVNKLFRNAPRTAEAFELKEEMTNNLIEKYNDLVSEGMDEKEAYDAVIAGIGDMSELINGFEIPESERPKVPEHKSICPHPFRRYFARLLDRNAFTLIVTIACVLISGRKPDELSAGIYLAIFYLSELVNMALMAALISKFGFTPGKKIFGIHIFGPEKRKLSFIEAFRREIKVFVFGEALLLPIVSYIAMFISYRKCKERKVLAQDKDIMFDIKAEDKEKWLVVYIAAMLLITMADRYAGCLGYIPPHRGDITKEQFIENYQYIIERMDAEDTVLHLNDKLRLYRPEGMVKSYADVHVAIEPAIENGKIVAVNSSVEVLDTSFEAFNDEFRTMILAFGDLNVFEINRLLEGRTEDIGFLDDVNLEIGDLKIEYTCDNDGYKMDSTIYGDPVIMDEIGVGADGSRLRIDFNMTKE